MDRKKSIKEFLQRKDIEISVQRYLIDALSYMALGLFASLLIGTIFSTLGDKFSIEEFTYIADFSKGATGAALGVAIAYALKAPPLVLFSAVTVGIAGNTLGGPVGALISTIIAVEFGKLVSKETKVDIIVTPAVTLIIGVIIAQVVGPGVSAIMTSFGDLIMRATEMQPFFMGILVSVLVGIALTLPISSAAICVMLNLSGIPAGAGMGTAGLVGPFGVINAMGNNDNMVWIGIILICFILPAIITFILGEVFRKIGWIKEKDLKLTL